MKEDIVIVGAGASGLMAARELSKTGKSVIICEARNRCGGRIYTFEKELFGYPAEAGAEFIHGDLPLTTKLVKNAGLTLIKSEGDLWNARSGELSRNDNFIPNWSRVIQKLQTVQKDLPIGQFLDKEFPKDKFRHLHDSIKGYVEGFDAADPEKASTIALREEWISEEAVPQYRIKEGYSALIGFLEQECIKNGVKFLFDSEVVSIHVTDKVIIKCKNEKELNASKVILTLPIPVVQKISFTPPVTDKIKATSKVGYGTVIKFLFQFRDRWWTNLPERNLQKAGFFFSNETVPTWWTQYPEVYPVLTGWLSGPKAEIYAATKTETLLETAIASLSSIFKQSKEKLYRELKNWKISNWKEDPYSLGAYAYSTPETPEAKKELLNPVDHKIFFAGEALYTGKETGTVEAALASGLKTAEEIQKIK